MRFIPRTFASLLLFVLLAAPAFAVPLEELEYIELQDIPKYERLCGGGGGRYVLLHCKAEKKIAVVDLEAGEVKGAITLPAEDAVFGAGQTKAVIALPAQKMLQRWDLETLKREKTIPLGDLAPRWVVVGSASEGPVLMWQHDKVQLWDLATLKPQKTGGTLLGCDSMYNYNITAAADGRTFIGWLGGISGQQFNVMRLTGSTATVTTTPDGHDYAGIWAVPAADGSYFIRYGGSLYDYAIKPITAESLNRWAIVPCDDPRFLLGAMRDEKDEKNFSTISIWSANDRQHLCSIEKVPTITPYEAGGPDLAHHIFQFRVRFVPKLNRMLILPEGNERAILITLNLEEHLKRTLKDQGADYVYVVSKPPATVTVGDTFHYQLETYTSNDELTYTLESGPDGMRVDKAGLVEWKATRPTGGVASAVIAVTNASGAETFHSFELHVERSAVASKPPKQSKPKSKSKPPKESPAEPDEPAEEPGDEPKPDARSGKNPGKKPAKKQPVVNHELPSVRELEALSPGPRNRRELSSKEIGRTYLKSVVLINTDRAIGTGFVIGSRGYILTCAHVVGDAETCNITLQADDDAEKTTLEATVLKVDIERDLALLKVDAKARFTPVRFTTGKVETGEKVTAIGNPGLGDRVLSSTMTEGIVSNPRRELDGLFYVQTSAAVNPGSSGGPLFNAIGEVIGLVVLKGRIEGAGFAVPAPDIGLFLGAAQAPEKNAEQNESPYELRTWSDPSGKFKIKATFAGRAGTNVKLKKPNGEIVTVPATRLSAADQEYLKTLK